MNSKQDKLREPRKAHYYTVVERQRDLESSKKETVLGKDCPQ